jgi:hypothetical protein
MTVPHSQTRIIEVLTHQLTARVGAYWILQAGGSGIRGQIPQSWGYYQNKVYRALPERTYAARKAGPQWQPGERVALPKTLFRTWRRSLGHSYVRAKALGF